MESQETANLARIQENAEHVRSYKDRLKLKKQHAELDSSNLSSKKDSLPTILFETNHCQDINCEKFIISLCQEQSELSTPKNDLLHHKADIVGHESLKNKRIKKSTERTRLFRARQKLGIKLEKHPPNIAAQRARAYRARKKAKKALLLKKQEAKKHVVPSSSMLPALAQAPIIYVPTPASSTNGNHDNENIDCYDVDSSKLNKNGSNQTFNTVEIKHETPSNSEFVEEYHGIKTEPDDVGNNDTNNYDIKLSNCTQVKTELCSESSNASQSSVNLEHVGNIVPESSNQLDATNTTSTMDRFDVYGKYVAFELQQLNVETSLQAQEKIMELLKRFKQRERRRK